MHCDVQDCLFEGFEKVRSFVHNKITPHMPDSWILVSKGSAKTIVRFRQIFYKEHSHD